MSGKILKRALALCLCMLLLGSAHIGEVQSSLWPDEMAAECEKHGIQLL